MEELLEYTEFTLSSNSYLSELELKRLIIAAL